MKYTAADIKSMADSCRYLYPDTASLGAWLDMLRIHMEQGVGPKELIALVQEKAKAKLELAKGMEERQRFYRELVELRKLFLGGKGGL